MAEGWYRGLARSGALLACLVAAATLPGGSQAYGITDNAPLRLLQLNLCNSGIAPCFTGRSVPEAAALIRARAPDVVTVNEVCEPDMSALATAMGAARANAARVAGTIVWVFAPAIDRRTAGPFHCLDGQRYGIGLLLRLPRRRTGHREFQGTYPAQDTRDPEERVWVCVDPDAGPAACTTHLASTSAAVALAQCRYLFGRILPSIRARDGYRPVVLGGDLNLRADGAPNVRSCVPAGYPRRDDGGVQQVVATAGFAVVAAATLDLAGTTDHPGLLVELQQVGSR